MVQSVSADGFALAVATMRRNDGPVAISTVNVFASLSFAGGRRVQRITLSGCGSLEATPCGYRSRRSRHSVVDACTRSDRNASEAPHDAASSMNLRRDIGMGCYR